MLKLQLFGTGHASYCDQPLSGFPGQQCYLLICYLLLNRHHPHHRERLAAVFWSEYPTTTSRKYLRNTIWRLRHALQAAGVPVDEYLLITDDSISFTSSASYWLDIEAFEVAIAECQDLAGQDLTPEQWARLENAVQLYVGDLLEDIYEDWCLCDRERLRLMYMNALGRLLVFHEHNGTYERGLDYGRRILDCDPTRENVHRQLMRLFWLLGSPTEALAQYKCCAQVLREELGIPPMAKTRFLYKQMLRNQFDPATWPVHHNDRLPERILQDESVQVLANHALKRLNRLQAMSEETNTELQHIARLIRKALVDGSQA
jgi:DNA-binding SARP family transcriptional activator